MLQLTQMAYGTNTTVSTAFAGTICALVDRTGACSLLVLETPEYPFAGAKSVFMYHILYFVGY